MRPNRSQYRAVLGTQSDAYRMNPELMLETSQHNRQIPNDK